MEEKTNFRIIDADDYESDGEVVYSHQSLIMKGMKRIYELGALELHEGCDVKEIINGKPVIIHKPNEREQYINAIKQLKSGMACDFDEEFLKKIKELNEELEKKKKELLEDQKKSRDSLDINVREKFGLSIFFPSILYPGLPYLSYYKKAELQYYRDVFEELVLRISRKKFYSSDAVTG